MAGAGSRTPSTVTSTPQAMMAPVTRKAESGMPSRQRKKPTTRMPTCPSMPTSTLSAERRLRSAPSVRSAMRAPWTSSMVLKVRVKRKTATMAGRMRAISAGREAGRREPAQRVMAGVKARMRAERRPPTRMKGRRRPSQPAQTRSDQAPKRGETTAPSKERVLPRRAIRK